MILPIVAYGAPVLRTVAKEIDSDYTGLAKLIEDMWETMYASNGVGLAAPQINKDIRLFIIDSEQIFANQEDEDRAYTRMILVPNRYLSMRILLNWVGKNGLIMRVVSAFLKYVKMWIALRM